MPRIFNGLISCLALLAPAAPALADAPLSGEGGKLLLTGGVSQVKGAAGSGLVPWAVINSYESSDGIGVTLHETYVPLSDFTLHAPGVAVGFYVIPRDDTVDGRGVAEIMQARRARLTDRAVDTGSSSHMPEHRDDARIAPAV